MYLGLETTLFANALFRGVALSEAPIQKCFLMECGIPMKMFSFKIAILNISKKFLHKT